VIDDYSNGQQRNNIMQRATNEVNSNRVADQVVGGVVAPVAPGRSAAFITTPVLAGLCCLGLILFLVASTIVLALIPVYLPAKGHAAGRRSANVNLILTFANGSTVVVGPLNSNQVAVLQNYLQGQVNGNSGLAGSTVSISSATATATRGGRKRQVQFAPFCNAQSFLTVISGRTTLARLIAFLESLIIPLNILQQIQNLASGSGSGSSNGTSSTNTTRSLVRRSLEEGGAPTRMVYIDSHEIASLKGNVSSVSFYVDRTCAMSIVEFGAFELVNRNVEMNTAELILTHRSGPLKLDSTIELKPYMNMITIRLCAEKRTANDIYDENCKGNQFPVLPHQYLGVRSDTCRLGFSPTPTNRILATTWKPSDKSDPFAEPYEKVKYEPSDYTVLQSVTIDSSEVTTNQLNNQQKPARNSPRVLFVGSYPPRRCGLAKFLEDLTEAYQGPYHIAAVDEKGLDLSSRIYSEKVVYRLSQDDRDAYYGLAEKINSGAYDIVNIQHEYGLYGGMLGEYVIHLLGAIKKPVIITLHTILAYPNTFYLSITRAICASSTRVIVLSNYGRQLLINIYGVDESKIVVIPHGVPDVPYTPSLADAKTKLGFDPNTPTMTTFGLLNRNKNIELGLKSLEVIAKSIPNIMYLIIGQTHPAIQANEGESYRDELQRNVSALGLSNNVLFVNNFVDDHELLDYLNASDIYLTPYAAEDQYVSGTLSWAVGLGKAVVSTPYVYAKELLSDGRGFLTPFNDDQFMGSLIVKILQDETVRNGARHHAYKYGRRMAWPTVAKDFEQICRELLLYN
jgi:glycosyltransferase involved in cell wall biosynthesis